MKKYIGFIILNILVILGIGKYLFSEETDITPSAYRFTFVCPTQWDMMAGGMMDADAELQTNTRLVGYTSPNEEKQLTALHKAIYSNVKGIITSAMQNSEEFTDAINEAEKEGIPVVLLESDFPMSDRSCYIGLDNTEAGILAGQDMIDATKSRGSIGVIVSALNKNNQRQRLNGFYQAISRQSNMKIVRIIECGSDRLKIRKDVEEMLQEHPEINALYCADETAGEMLGEILADMRKTTEEYAVVSFGLSDQVWNYVSEGRYDYVIASDYRQQGYLAVSYLKEYLNGRQTDVHEIYTEILNVNASFDYASWESDQKAQQNDGKAEWDNQ